MITLSLYPSFTRSSHPHPVPLFFRLNLYIHIYTRVAKVNAINFHLHQGRYFSSVYLCNVFVRFNFIFLTITYIYIYVCVCVCVCVYFLLFGMTEQAWNFSIWCRMSSLKKLKSNLVKQLQFINDSWLIKNSEW